MRKLFAILSIALMSAVASAPASAKTGTETASTIVENTLKFNIPVNLIVKQTITFTDGKSITVFYQKEGNICRLYSTVDVTKYSESDLNRIKSTNFELSDHVEGKCLLTRNCSDIIKFARSVIREVK